MKTYLLYYILIIFSGCNQVGLEDMSSMSIEYQFVNLKSAKERREKMESQLVSAKINYKIIDAILGKSLSSSYINKLVSDKIYDEQKKNSDPLKPGELGIYLSTINKALPNARANKNAITVTMEDDVVIPYDLDLQFRQALLAVPADWDILYLGCYQNYLARDDGSLIGPNMPSLLKEVKEYNFPLCPTNDALRVANTPWIELDGSCIAGMYAYALRSKTAEKLRNKLVPIKETVDLQITKFVGAGEIRAYCLNPELIRVNTTIPSTIR